MTEARLTEIRAAHAERQASVDAMDPEARTLVGEMLDPPWHGQRGDLLAEVDRLRECLRGTNANMEEMERALYLRLDAVEGERDRLREERATVLDAAGRAIQEAKHHHRGRGQPLEGTGGLSPGLRDALRALEEVTGG